MGVKNLWRLLLPCGHRLSIESLSHQTLAIDASIWLTQISMACRDPETGRPLPNKPHVRIFLLRLMRLLYHQIKPVVVFDGVMPEVKRREILRRKDRREKLWRDDEESGGGALKRTAKKILVKQLQERKVKESARGSKKRGRTNDGVAVGKPSNGGAFAAGFTGEDDDAPENNDNSSPAQQQPPKNADKEMISDPNNEAETGKNNNEDVISINSEEGEEDGKEQGTHKFQSQLDQYRQKHGGADEGNGEQYESENDWEMSRAVQSSIDDSIRQQQQKPSSSETKANNKHSSGGTAHSYKSRNNPFDHEHYQQASNKTIASLPTDTRSKWIDNQLANRRIQSRRECIEHAADPEEYSSSQLRNFLMGSKLNKRVNDIGKLAESGKDVGGGPDDGGGGFARTVPVRPALGQPKGHDGDEGDGGLLTSANESDEGGVSMKVLFGEDDSHDDESEGGGGFVASSPKEPTTTDATADSAQNKCEESEIILLDDDSDNDSNNSQIDGNAAMMNKFASANVNGKVDQRNSLSPSKNTKNTTDTFQPSTLFELSTADQEWEEWAGVDATNEKTDLLEVESNNHHQNRVDNSRNNGSAELNASESDSDSDSDDDDELGDSFLMLGSRPLSNQADELAGGFVAKSAATKETAERICVAPINADKTLQSDALDTEEDEDDVDDVDWEDGDSGDDQVQDEANSGMKIGSQDLGLHESEDIHRNGDNSVTEWTAESACHAAESLKTNATIPVRNGTGEHQKNSLEKNAANNIESRFNDENNHVIEIPSEDDAICAKRGDDIITKKSNLPPESISSPDNTKEEPLMVIDSSDESPSENKNQFDSFRHHDNQTTAALQNAQETASRLTSWAGRAFQRAMSDHVGQQQAYQSDLPREKVDSETEQKIGLAASNDIIIDADAGDNNGAVDTTEVKVLDQSNTTAGMDGGNHAPSQEQQNTRGRELDLFDTSLEGLNEAHNAILEEEKAMERDMSTITDEMKEDIISLLRLCGIPWVESPSEAEAQCAALEELGLVDGTVTEDSDIFVFGGRKVYKNFFDEKKFVEAYFARDIERDLALKKHQLVALAMLLGGDYTDGVKGVGIVNGMEALRAFPIGDSADGIKHGLNEFREWLDGFGDPSPQNGSENDSKRYLSNEALFHKKHKTARTRWVAPADFPSQAIMNAYLKPVVDKSNARFSWGKPDLHGLQQYCADTLGWEQEETDRIVNPVLKVLESGSKQTRLESYFMRYEDGITFAKVRSKRLKAVLEDIQDNNGNNANKDIEQAIAEGDDAEMEASDPDEGAKPKKRKKRQPKN